VHARRAHGAAVGRGPTLADCVTLRDRARQGERSPIRLICADVGSMPGPDADRQICQLGAPTAAASASAS
jgi:hypothetical protein